MNSEKLIPIDLHECKIGDRVEYGYKGAWKWIRGTIKKVENKKYHTLSNVTDMKTGQFLGYNMKNWVPEQGMWHIVKSMPTNTNETFKSKSGKMITCEVKHVV